MTKNTAALYLRSSKDRSDMSPAAQRRMLQELAQTKGLAIVAEFSDTVESGKDENRPGFQKLLHAIRNPKRGWSKLLVIDTARIARRRHIAVIFEEMECRKRSVEVIYRSLPETDPITTMLLKSILQAMDEWHSLTSRDKGLAGMAENVRSGFRAGGRAPTGYRLVQHSTGAIRDGEAVTKSKLEPDPAIADRVGRYLAVRAAGTGRTQAARECGLTLAGASLIGIEWNALTYAGHTVWNVHAELKDGQYVGGQKRRPRSEWVIQQDTHPALITQEQADLILGRLETFNPHKTRNRGDRYLLSGLLKTPAGTPWWGYGEKYRSESKGPSTYVSRDALEQGVMGRVMEDLKAPHFVQALTRAAQTLAADVSDDTSESTRSEVAALASKISRLVDMASEMVEPAPIMRKISELEQQRAQLAECLQEQEAAYQQRVMLNQITEHHVRSLLGDIANNMADADRPTLKSTLATMIERIDLDPSTLACQIHYRVGADSLLSAGNRVKDASPWGRQLSSDSRPAIARSWKWT
jgi:site-specific DNA recombinase